MYMELLGCTVCSGIVVYMPMNLSAFTMKGIYTYSNKINITVTSKAK